MFSKLVHETVNNSFFCLITLEDLKKEENFLLVYNNPKLHRKKCEIYWAMVSGKVASPFTFFGTQKVDFQKDLIV